MAEAVEKDVIGFVECALEAFINKTESIASTASAAVAKYTPKRVSPAASNPTNTPKVITATNEAHDGTGNAYDYGLINMYEDSNVLIQMQCYAAIEDEPFNFNGYILFTNNTGCAFDSLSWTAMCTPVAGDFSSSSAQPPRAPGVGEAIQQPFNVDATSVKGNLVLSYRYNGMIGVDTVDEPPKTTSWSGFPCNPIPPQTG